MDSAHTQQEEHIRSSSRWNVLATIPSAAEWSRQGCNCGEGTICSSSHHRTGPCYLRSSPTEFWTG